MSLKPFPPFSGAKLKLGDCNTVKWGEALENFMKPICNTIGQELKRGIAKNLPQTTSEPGPHPVRQAFPGSAAGQALFDTAVARHDASIIQHNASCKVQMEKEGMYAVGTAALVETMDSPFFEQMKAQSAAAKEAWSTNDPLTLRNEMVVFSERNTSGGSKYSKFSKIIASLAAILARYDSSNLIDSSTEITEVLRRLRKVLTNFPNEADWRKLGSFALIHSLCPVKYDAYKTKQLLLNHDVDAANQVPDSVQQVVTAATLSLASTKKLDKKADRTKTLQGGDPPGVHGGRGLAPTGNLPQKLQCTNCGKGGHTVEDCWSLQSKEELKQERSKQVRFDDRQGGGRGGRGDQQQGRGGRGGRGGGGAGGGQHAAGRNPKRQGGGAPAGDDKKRKKFGGGIRLDQEEPFEAGTIDDDFHELTGTIARSCCGRREDVDARESHQSEATSTKSVDQICHTDSPMDTTVPTSSNVDPQSEQLHHRNVEEHHPQVPPASRFKTAIHYGIMLCIALAAFTFIVMCSVDLTPVEEAYTMIEHRPSHDYPQVLVPDPLYDYDLALEGDTVAVWLNRTQDLSFQIHFWGDLVPYDHADTWLSHWNDVTVPLQILIAGIMTIVVVGTLIVSARLRSQEPPELINITHVVLLPRAQSAIKDKASKISHDTGTQVTVIVPGDPYAGEVRKKRLAVQGVGGKKQYSKEVFHNLLQVWGALAEPGELPASLVSTADIEQLHDYDGAFVEPCGQDKDGNIKTRLTHQIWSNRSKSGPDLVFERVLVGEDADLLIYNEKLTVEDL